MTTDTFHDYYYHYYCSWELSRRYNRAEIFYISAMLISQSASSKAGGIFLFEHFCASQLVHFDTIFLVPPHTVMAPYVL